MTNKTIQKCIQGSYGKVFLDNQQLCVLKYIDMKVVPVYADFYVGLTPCKKAVSIQYIGKIKLKTENLIFEGFIKDKNVQFTIECNFADTKKVKYTLYGVTFDKLFIEDIQKGNISEKIYKYKATDVAQQALQKINEVK